MIQPKHLQHVLALWGCALLVACGADFEPYNRLSELRVLAVRADPPWPAPTEATRLQAAVYSPDGATPAYAWSWCPWRGSSDAGYECAVAAADFEAFLERAGVPTPTIDYDLGTEESASFRAPLPSTAVAALCAGLAGDDPPPYVPDCVGGLPISIGLELRGGGSQVTAMKDVTLRLDEQAATNANPIVTGLRLGRKPTTPADAEPVPADGERPRLVRGETYELFAEVSLEAAEAYTTPITDADPEPTARRELLLLTWFIEAGETKHVRTSFAEGEVELDEATHNEWTLPERGAYGADRAKIILIVRDDRGGVGWLERSVDLVDP